MKNIFDEFRYIYNIEFVYIYILRTNIIEDNRQIFLLEDIIWGGYLEKNAKRRNCIVQNIFWGIYFNPKLSFSRGFKESYSQYHFVFLFIRKDNSWNNECSIDKPGLDGRNISDFYKINLPQEDLLYLIQLGFSGEKKNI